MLYLKRIILSLICLIYLTSNLLAENKVAYIDLDKILASTDSGKTLFKQLNNLEKLELESFKNEEKKLKLIALHLICKKNKRVTTGILSYDLMLITIKEIKNFKQILDLNLSIH